MKNAYFALCLFLSNISYSQSPKTEVLVLGTTHLFSIKDDSVTSPKKSKELKYFLSQLEKFKPEQIFVEATPDNDEYFLKIQNEIIKTKKDPSETWLLNNEYYQIGIKLAAKLDIKTGIQGIDWPDPDTNDTTKIFKTKYEKAYFNFVKELRIYAMEKKFEVEDSTGLEILEKIVKESSPYFQLNKKVSLIEMYKFLNLPENLKKSHYVNRMGNLLLNASGVGAELNSVESFRDFKIYRNALTRIDKKTKRVLIIYGSGHVHVLKDHFSMDPRFKILEVSQFLK
jgi:hypothetical protein